MSAVPRLVDELAARVGHGGIAGWLADLARVLGLVPDELMPDTPRVWHTVRVPRFGQALALRHPHAAHVAVGDPQRWVLAQVDFEPGDDPDTPWQDLLPFGLDAEGETAASAAGKLGCEEGGQPSARSADRLRETYFLDHGRVVEIAWRSGGVGIRRVRVARLGNEVFEGS